MHQGCMQESEMACSNHAVQPEHLRAIITFTAGGAAAAGVVLLLLLQSLPLQ